jgi:hypothetical protein
MMMWQILSPQRDQKTNRLWNPIPTSLLHHCFQTLCYHLYHYNQTRTCLLKYFRSSCSELYIQGENMADEFPKWKEQNPSEKDKDFPKGIFKPVTHFFKFWDKWWWLIAASLELKFL